MTKLNEHGIISATAAIYNTIDDAGEDLSTEQMKDILKNTVMLVGSLVMSLNTIAEQLVTLNAIQGTVGGVFPEHEQGQARKDDDT